MDILADITQNSKFEEDAVNRERDTILREMKSVDEQMEEVVFDRLHETAFRGSSLSRTILGSVENIKSISRADIIVSRMRLFVCHSLNRCYCCTRTGLRADSLHCPAHGDRRRRRH